MTRYERVQEAIGRVEHRLKKEEIESLLLVVDLPDHREELGSVHVDSTRAVLDWFCEKHPNHPICIGSSSKQDTKLAFREFGYHNLEREYERVYFQDLNHEPVAPTLFPELVEGLTSYTKEHLTLRQAQGVNVADSSRLVVFLSSLHAEPSGVRTPSRAWGEIHSQSQRHYTPYGEEWRLNGTHELDVQPDLVVVDAMNVKSFNHNFEPIPMRLNRVFARVDLNEADRVSLEVSKH